MALRKKRPQARPQRAPPEPGSVMTEQGLAGMEIQEPDLEFMDLRDWVSPKAEDYAEKPVLTVRSAEVTRPKDIGPLLKLLYDGELLLLDFESLANDPPGFRTTLNDLQKAVKDLDGDLVGLGRNYLIAAPKGARVVRRKLRLESSEDRLEPGSEPDPKGT